MNKLISFLESKYAMISMGIITLFATGNAYALDNLGTGTGAIGYQESLAFGLWLLGLLTGPLGFAFAVIAFFMGLWMYVQKQQLWATMGCIAAAILILIIPRILQNFFGVVVAP